LSSEWDFLIVHVLDINERLKMCETAEELEEGCPVKETCVEFEMCDSPDRFSELGLCRLLVEEKFDVGGCGGSDAEGSPGFEFVGRVADEVNECGTLSWAENEPGIPHHAKGEERAVFRIKKEASSVLEG
jgi:hypothetical protein